jgi:DNA gyrase subunit A
MKLNPHGDMAIYETLVRLSRGNASLLHPLIDSKGNFGKVYSRDMAFAAARYTEAKLDSLCAELFRDIDKDTVDFTDNYDNTMKEPALLPTTFPSILINANQGIAVGMASSICSFNLKEVCDTTVELLKNPEHDVSLTLKAPDFTTGGGLLYSHKEMKEIYESGKGSFKVRSKYTFDKKNNCVEITEIPYTTTAEAIIDKIVELVKTGKIRDIADVRDETDLSGLKLTIDLKRGADPDKLMQKLFKMTPLEDAFACNFNVLISGIPQTLGVSALLGEWIAFRTECVKRGLHYDMTKKKDRLHLLRGLDKILLDIDKAIRIVRDTEDDAEVIPNLMIGFGIDEPQAEFVAEIKLRNLNKNYILGTVNDISRLEAEIADIEQTLKSRERLRALIVRELEHVAKKFAQPRRTEILHEAHAETYVEDDFIEDYPVHLFLTKEGYFKKITPASLRMSGEHKLKDGDAVSRQIEATNKSEILIFTSACQVYKCRAHDFEDTKASALGDYLPAKMSMDPSESVLYMAVPGSFRGSMLFFFDNGRVSRVEMSAYATKTNRKKLSGAFCSKFPLVAAMQIEDDLELALFSSAGKVLVFSSASVPPKVTRDNQGVIVMALRGRAQVQRAVPAAESGLSNPALYRSRNLPAAGLPLKSADR